MITESKKSVHMRIYNLLSFHLPYKSVQIFVSHSFDLSAVAYHSRERLTYPSGDLLSLSLANGRVSERSRPAYLDLCKMPEDTTRCTCERCQLKDSTNQLRPSDEVLCDKCYQKERKQADEINVNETSTDIQNEENIEDQNGYVVDEKDEDEDCMPACTFVTAHWLNPEAEEFTSVIIKNSSGVDVCSKCRKKLVNGIRCTTCKKPWHWGCSGMSTDAGHDQLCNWECITYTGTDINCQSCKLKDNEVENLKKNISELELKLQELNKARKTNNERITDLEDRLDREKKLRGG